MQADEAQARCRYDDEEDPCCDHHEDDQRYMPTFYCCRLNGCWTISYSVRYACFHAGILASMLPLPTEGRGA